MTAHDLLVGRQSTWPGRRWVSVIALAILIAGCTGGPLGLRGSGQMTSETRDVSGFTEVVLEGSGTVLIEVTGTESLSIEAEDNLMSRITSDVRSGRLVLGSRGAISPTREIVYTVTVASLEGVVISGSGDIETAGITAPEFTAEISGSGRVLVEDLELGMLHATIEGSGNIEASGVAEDLELRVPGSGSFRGEDLETVSATVSIDGSGEALINFCKA